MAFSRTLRCKKCGNEWKQLVMSRAEPPSDCDFGCADYPEEGLSAPNVNRGDAKPGQTIPQSQAGREKLAADLALKHTGMGDINSHMKPGDIAAKPIRPNLPSGIAPSPAITPQFIDTKGMGYAQAAADPARGRNLGILSAIGKAPALNRLPRSVLSSRKQ